MADYFVGCDLGKLTDPTALTVMCRSLSVNSLTGLPEKSARGDYLYRWECRALKRYKLGTPYLAIVADVLRSAIVASCSLRQACPGRYWRGCGCHRDVYPGPGRLPRRRMPNDQYHGR